MFRKPDQDLFARVFDEGQSGDASMEWLRDGLKELRDVPAHGLSNERLRDRVLGTGLAPAKSSSAPWWSWAWAPVAAAAIAVVVLPRFRTAAEPQVILNPNRVAIGGPAFRNPMVASTSAPDRVTSGAPQVQSADSFDVEAALAEAARLPDVVTPASRPVAKTSRVRSRVIVTRERVLSPTATRRAKESSKSLVTTTAPLVVAAKEPDPIEEPASVATFASVADASPSVRSSRIASSHFEPLVVLAPEIDAATGAASATEVDSPANLSIGG